MRLEQKLCQDEVACMDDLFGSNRSRAAALRRFRSAGVAAVPPRGRRFVLFLPFGGFSAGVGVLHGSRARCPEATRGDG